jgi:hypothetical protein
MNKRFAITITAFLACSAVMASVWHVALFGQTRQSAKSPAAQLQELIDKQAIHQLFMNYGRTLDSRDFAGFERLFARDAEYGGGANMVKGPAAIRARLEAALKQNGAPAPGRDWHFFFNETIDVHGDEATAVSMGAFFVRGENNKLESNSVAIYDDLVTREDGTWKFKRRRLGNTVPPWVLTPSSTR